MPQLPLNTTYTEQGNIATKALGEGLKRFQPPPRPQPQAQPQPQTGPAPMPGSFSNLGKMTVPYGGSTRYEAKHPGVDIANAIGTPIPAFSGGTVSQVVSGKKQGDPGFGNFVVVTDPQGGKHRYSHLNQAFVKVGTPIKRGQQIGTMGHSGQTYSESGGSGSHLDIRIRDAFGKYANPFTYLKNLS